MNSFQMKLLMMLLMVLDHLSIIPNFLSHDLIGIFHFITRPVALWFAYGLVEGFLHTHDCVAYCKRLFTFAILMQLGNFVVMFITKIPIYNSIILALAFSCLMLIFFFDDTHFKSLSSSKRTLFGCLSYLACTLLAEGSLIIPTCVLIFYYNHNNLKKMTFYLLILSALMFIPSLEMMIRHQGTWMDLLHGEWFYISIIPFIMIYNGKKGNSSPFAKYLFYFFYPAHIWILTMIAATVAH